MSVTFCKFAGLVRPITLWIRVKSRANRKLWQAGAERLRSECVLACVEFLVNFSLKSWQILGKLMPMWGRFCKKIVPSFLRRPAHANSPTLLKFLGSFRYSAGSGFASTPKTHFPSIFITIGCFHFGQTKCYRETGNNGDTQMLSFYTSCIERLSSTGSTEATLLDPNFLLRPSSLFAINF